MFSIPMAVFRSTALQMVTTEGNNCHVVAVKGSFDDAQTGVKKLFTDAEFAADLKKIMLYFLRRTLLTGAVWFRKSPTIGQLMPTY